MHHNFFICSSVDGHLGHFHIVALVDTASMNSEHWGACTVKIFSHICPGVGFLADSFLVKPMLLIR